MALRHANPEVLVPYVPRIALHWAADFGDARFLVLDASLVFVDISGFTALSERLSQRGRQGAEELTVAVSTCFADLLTVAYEAGGSLLKFGGDALLLLFDGERHAQRAAVSAQRMQHALANVGRVATTGGSVRLRMSVGVHSGEIHLFRVGHSHAELIVTGEAASTTVAMESIAGANEIVVSAATAAQLDRGAIGVARGDGFVLRNRRLETVSAPIAPFAHLAHAAAEGVPVALRDELLTGDVESEHRRVAIGFVHFDGVDELLASSGPDRVADALDELVGSVQVAVESQGVTFLATDVDRDGGKIILVGGAPRALGDDAGRMARALHRIANTRRTLPVRVGATYGHVFVGSVGPSFRRTYTIMGDAVNLAARLMAKASPGKIVATEALLTNSRTHFQVEALPPFVVKGKAEPVEAFDVGAPLAGREHDPIAPDLPVLGRDREVAVLTEALDGALHGRGGLIELCGPAGIGKSRLIERVHADARSAGAVVVRVFCEPFEMQTPYFAIRFLLRALLGITARGSEGASSLRDAVKEVAPALTPWLPLLATVVDVDVEPTAVTDNLEARFRRERTQWAVGELLRAIVAEPTVMLVEDGQWLDQLSAELLAVLAAKAVDAPWLVCVARRDGSELFQGDAAGVRTLALDPIDDGAARALVTLATVDAPLLPHVRDALVERAGGNPLFLTELIRFGHDATFPESLEATVAIEIDRLPSDDRRLLRYAAVLGATFDAALLADITDGEIPSAAVAARRFDVFLEKAGPGLVRFRNQCFRQVAYDTLPFARRRELHARVGDFIERSMTGNVDERASALSLHFLYAQRYEQCWQYAQIAARHAESRYANAEAAELYERALGASRKLPGIAGDELARVFESLGDVALLAGLFERASWAFARARRLHADDPSGLVGLCHKQARVALHLGRRTTADRWISRGLRLLGDQPTSEQRARRAALRTMFANNRQLAGRPRLTRRWALLAIEDGIASDNRGALASAYLLLDWALITMGKPEDAHHARLALEIWTEKGDVGRQAEALTYLGYFAYLRGDWDDALQQWARATDAYERAGNTIDAALGVSNSAELLIGQGRYDEAEPMLRTALEVWRAARYPAVTGVLCHQAKIAMYRGDVDTAAALFDDVQDRARSLAGTLDIDVASGRAECWLLQGEPRPALDLVDEALRTEAATGGAAFAARLHRLRAFSLAALGGPDAARADLDRSVSIARDQGATFELAMSLDALCAFGDAYGDPLDGRVADERTTLFRQLGVVARPPSLLEVAGTVGVRPVGVSSLSPAGWGR